MNFLKLTLISTSLVLIGCGSNSGNNETPINNIPEAKKSFKSLDAFQSIDISSKSIATSTKLINKINKGNISSILSIYDDITLSNVNRKASNDFSTLEKKGTRTCRDGGSFQYYISDDKNDMDISYKECKTGTKTENGKVSVRSNKDEIALKYINYTETNIGGKLYIDYQLNLKINSKFFTIVNNGIIKKTNNAGETFTKVVDNMLYEFTNENNDIFFKIGGKITLYSKCFNGVYNFKTPEKLTIKNYKTNHLFNSGVLKINTATYTFKDAYVTIETKDETKKILQNDLKKESTTENIECTE